jgi:biotin carboxylase
MKPIVILAHVPSEPVTRGFVPAARRLGFPVVLLTDRLEEQQETFSRVPITEAPESILACDVFNPLSVLEATLRLGGRPAAIFSNSDHLQTSTALVASYHGLPGKDWTAAFRAKNKAEMRRWLGRQGGVERVWHASVSDEEGLRRLGESVPLPCVVKPAEGVASEQVQLARTREEVGAACRDIWRARPGQRVVLEEYLEGPLVTLETLGEFERLWVLGGFRTHLSPPPYFIEKEAWWGTGLTERQEEEMVALLRDAGVGFGACHTEFVLTEAGPRVIEINYRTVGDSREFLLDEALGIRLFEQVLRLHLGAPLEMARTSPVAAGIRYFCAERSGVLSRVPAAFRRTEGELTLTFTPTRAEGTELRLTNSNRDYLGVLRGFGGTQEALARAFDRIGEELRWELK